MIFKNKILFNSHKSLNVTIEVLILSKKLSIMITYYPFKDITTLVVEIFSALVRVSSLLAAFYDSSLFPFDDASLCPFKH